MKRSAFAKCNADADADIETIQMKGDWGGGVQIKAAECLCNSIQVGIRSKRVHRLATLGAAG